MANDTQTTGENLIANWVGRRVLLAYTQGLPNLFIAFVSLGILVSYAVGSLILHDGLAGFFIGLLLSLVFGILFFGPLFTLIEINENLKTIRKSLEERWPTRK